MDRLAATKEYIRLVEKTLTELYEDNQRMREQILRELFGLKDEEIERLNEIIKKEKLWTKKVVEFVTHKDKKLVSEVERLRKEVETKNRYIDECLEIGQTRIKEIERLRKEKEWLITQLCKDWDQDAHGTEKEDLKGFINKQMQQALEEE